MAESWHIPRALSDEALRLLTALPMEEVERRLRGPAPAADGEVAELVQWLRSLADLRRRNFALYSSASTLTRAADLLERQALRPMPVSERLPGPGDCAPWPDESDASAWCWVGSDVDGGWSWEQRSAGCLAAFPDDFTHWLPAHALPLPEFDHE